MAHFYDRELLEDQVFQDADDDEGFLDDFVPETEEEPEELIFRLHLEDGSELTCRAVAVFLAGEKEYIALEAEENEIHIMELLKGEDDSVVLEVPQEEEERELAWQAFMEIFEEDKDDDRD